MGRRSHPLYDIWRGVLRRCENPKNFAWKYYGGRVIRVCERWHDFDKFVADMGTRPEGTTLDRYPNNDGDYEPGNCRWATHEEQHRNKRSNHNLTFRGRTQTMWQWADDLSINPFALARRIKNGWTTEEALTIPVTGGRKGLCRRVLWRVLKDTSPKGLVEARKVLAARRLERYKKSHPEKFNRPRKVRTRCRHCDKPPVVGTSLCWDHSWSNPDHRKRYQDAYRGVIR